MAKTDGVGARIRSARVKQHMTQIQLARQVGVEPATVWNWEKGKHDPQALTLPAVARVLGVSENYLTTGTATTPTHRSVSAILADARKEIALASDVEIDQVEISCTINSSSRAVIEETANKEV